MRLLISATLLLIATALFAGEFVPPSDRPPFPDDFKTVACAPTICESFDVDDFRSAAFQFLGLSVNQSWFTEHEDEMKALVVPFCRKRNACIATPGNGHMFCDDLVTPEIRSACEKKYPKATTPKDFEQCSIWIETWALGVTQRSYKPWIDSQECSKAGAVTHTETPDVWMAPKTIPSDYTGYVTFYAIDRQTHIPVFGHMSWENQVVYAPSNPTGETATYYPFKGPFKLARVPRADGHSDVVGQTIVMKFDYYPTVTFRLAVEVPQMVVKMEADPLLSKPGKHTITITAKDAVSGAPVEAEVMLGDAAIGETNHPVTFERNRGEKLPDIWLTSLFDRYSDVVVAPAEK